MAVTPNLTELAMARMMGVDIPPPGAKKIKIKVVSRTSGHAVAGTVVPAGESVLEIYDVHFEEFAKLVEDERKLDLAAEQHERDREQYEAIKAGKEGTEEWRKGYEPSVPASFRDMFKRDVLPFDSVELYEPPTKRAAA